MGQPTPAADPMPLRHRLFAPWTWWRAMRPWQRWAMVAALLVGYVLSEPMVDYLSLRFGVAWHRSPSATIYYPLDFLMKRSRVLTLIYVTEWVWINRAFGPAKPKPGDER